MGNSESTSFDHALNPPTRSLTTCGEVAVPLSTALRASAAIWESLPRRQTTNVCEGEDDGRYFDGSATISVKGTAKEKVKLTLLKRGGRHTNRARQCTNPKLGSRSNVDDTNLPQAIFSIQHAFQLGRTDPGRLRAINQSTTDPVWSFSTTELNIIHLFVDSADLLSFDPTCWTRWPSLSQLDVTEGRIPSGRI